MKFRLTFHIKLVSFKNIDIWLIYGLESIKFVAYVQIWAYGFWLITQPFFVQPGYEIVYKLDALINIQISNGTKELRT